MRFFTIALDDGVRYSIQMLVYPLLSELSDSPRFIGCFLIVVILHIGAVARMKYDTNPLNFPDLIFKITSFHSPRPY